MSAQHRRISRLTGVAGATVFATLALGAPPGPAWAGAADDPDLLNRQAARAGSADPVAVADLSRHHVDLGDTSVSLADLAGQVFREKADLLRQLRTAPDAAVFGRPTTTLRTTELSDSYVLTQTTGVVVSDPVRLADASATYRQFRGDPDALHPVTRSCPPRLATGLTACGPRRPRCRRAIPCARRANRVGRPCWTPSTWGWATSP